MARKTDQPGTGPMVRRLDIEKTRVPSIVVQPRLRRPSDSAIERMAQSLGEIGLITPIAVRVVDEMEINGEVVCGVPVLIHGATRLAAAALLGWEFIDTQIVEADDIDARLAEIAENLHREELTVQERAEHLARRKDIYIARHPETRQGSAGGHGKHGSATDKLSFAGDTASKTGMDERSIQRAVRRSERIASDVKDRIKDTAIADSGIELDALAAATPTEQRRMVDLVINGEAENIRAAKQMVAPDAKPVKLPDAPLNDFESVQKQVSTLMSAWNKAAPDAREQFLEGIDIGYQGGALNAALIHTGL
jgi:hypothetical protein